MKAKCAECGEIGIFPYMVKDAVWAKAGFKPKDYAHPSCLAKRLGRPLAQTDFEFLPCNDVVWAIFGPVADYKSRY